MLKRIATIVSVAVAPVMACISGSCSQNMCSDIPTNNVYYLTSFCDAEVACGSFSGDCNEYFMADYKRFGCNSIGTAILLHFDKSKEIDFLILFCSILLPRI